MALVPAICIQCGAQIEVDDTHEAGICKYCGTAFITEKVINNYVTNVTNQIYAKEVRIVDERSKELWRQLEAYDKMNDSQKRWKIITELSEITPWDPRVWLYLAKINSSSNSHYVDYMKKAISVADGTEKEELSLKLDRFIDDIKKRREETRDKLNKIFEDISIFDGLYCQPTGGYSYIVGTARCFYVKNNKLYYDGMEVDPIVYESVDPYSDYCFCMFIHKNQQKNYLKIKMSESSYFHRDSESAHYSPVQIWANELIELKEIGKKPSKSCTYDKSKVPISTTNTPANCYIATCVYGSYDCPEVWTLRRFRDDILDETWYGRVFIKCYYAISPTLVKWFGNQKWFRSFWKSRLDTMVSNLNQQGVKDTQYQDKY